MNQPLQLRILENQHEQHAQLFTGTVVLGRQEKGEGGQFSQVEKEGYLRVVIGNKDSGRDAKDISRSHVRLEPQPDGTIRVVNVSQTLDVVLGDGGILRPGQGRDRLSLPMSCVIGPKT